MSKISTRWFLGMAVGGAYALGANSAYAQITADTNLPNNSTVRRDGMTHIIEGGTQRGVNLFHSFQQFSVLTGETAHFNNALEIQNIFSRVTGGGRSDIDGLIRANGTANLFLINPNGIVFGPNASLNVGGSFVGTTANAIQFGTLGSFSATNPEAPSSLLTINPSALLFNQIPIAPIQNNSTAAAGKDLAGSNALGLRVPDGKSLLLVGGNINMDGGQLNAYGGRVELGGLAASGSVGLNVDGDKLSLDFPASSTRADIFLTNKAGVYVAAGGGGDITVNARNLEVSGGSVLSAGIGQSLGNAGAKAGNITLNATGDIKIDGDGSGITNNVQQQGIGNGGNITLSTNSLSLTNGAQLAASTFGQGNAGNVIINATNSVTLDGSVIFSFVGDVKDTPEQRNAIKGNGGNIQITSPQLSLTNGAQLAANTFGQGNAGNVIINATNSVSLDGSRSVIFSSVGDVKDTPEQRNAIKGNGGNIQITSPQLSLTNGAQLQANTFGQGNAGNVIINATNSVTLDGSVIFSSVGDVQDTPQQRNAIKGNSGNIQITTSQLSLTNGAQLTAGTLGQGDAGNVIINATKSVSLDGRYTNSNGQFFPSGIFSSVGSVSDTPEQRNAIKGNSGNIQITTSQLSLTNGAQLAASTLGQGNAGNVTVNARDAVSLANATILSTVGEGGVGKGGNIDINAATLSLKDGAVLSASTLGQGNAGNVTVNARDAVSLAGQPTGIFSTVEAGGVGKGGNIDIKAATLSLKDGAELVTATREASATQPAGRGDAGNVNVTVTGEVDIAGKKNGSASGIGSFVETKTEGNGGNITINSGSFSLRDGAQLSASTSGQGNAGNVTVNALNAVSLANATILSVVGEGGVGKGGNIEINAATLSLKDGAFLSASTSGQGNAGNVTVNALNAVSLANATILSVVGEGGVGKGGNIEINAATLSLKDGAFLSASTLGQGNAGNVKVNARDAVSLADADIFSTVEAGGVGKGGNIDINAATMSLIDGAALLTITRGASNTGPAGRGDAGNVNVKVSGAVDITGQKNGFRSAIGSFVDTGTVGNGGNITIDSGSFSLRDGAQLAALTLGQGNAGNVRVNALGAVSLAGQPTGIFSTVEAGGVGKGGNIDIKAATLSLTDGAQLSASTLGQGNAGNVTVNARDAVSLAGQPTGILSTVEAGGVGKGGDININAATLSLKDGAQLLTATRGASDTQPPGRGDAGNVNVTVSGAVDIAGVNGTKPSGIRSFVDTGTVGNGGNITINSGSFSLRDGAQLSASTFGQGNAGNVTVNARDAVSLANATILSTVGEGGVGKGGNIDINAATLSLKDGAQLATITRGASYTGPAGRGDAGNVNVKVSGAVDITGEKNGFSSGIFSSVQTGTAGNGGNITIDSDSFSLRDGAVLTAETLGQGNAGTIKVNAAANVTISGKSSDSISGLYVGSFSTTGTAGDIIVTSPRVTLDNSGTLNAQSASGNGGNINLQSGLLLLRHGAQISTSAGTNQKGGNGGNITINTPNGFIVSVPNENSDITANAFNGTGGVIKINALNIYNFTQRSREDLVRELKTDDPKQLDPQRLQTNDITAFSLTSPNLSGQVNIITPNIDPARGLVQLPAVAVNTPKPIATSCAAFDKGGSSFTITGRGGLPPSPDEPLTNDVVWTDTRLPATTSQQHTSNKPPTKPHSKPKAEPIVIAPAIGWVFNKDKSEVTLISSHNANSLGTTPATCPAQR